MISCLADTGHSVYTNTRLICSICLIQLRLPPFMIFIAWWSILFDDFRLRWLLHEYPNFLCIMACDCGFYSLCCFNDENITKTSIYETSSCTSLLLQVIFHRKREMRSGTVLVNLCKCVSIKVDMTSSRELKIVGEGGERLRLSVLRLIYGSSVFGIPIWNISHYSVL